ncbi:hypothetical protein GPECTOR_13g694 [Gonium pectorale]|uniref:Uncharacterized protein n=1 Tax=Gonium pectorale TaxID=33097 RepID=A0A150GN17_GONPE|nr:hypothetical protein GPECTOR_13g694 [Gonium pectorale]|eukprot:KXZ51207.1 hypothetical protein GPECTOR_13g694 [Gonium pectorale]
MTANGDGAPPMKAKAAMGTVAASLDIEGGKGQTAMEAKAAQWRYPTQPPWWKRLFFFDTDGLIYLGYRTRLEGEHLCQDPALGTKLLINQLEPGWQEQLKKPKPDLKRALLRGNVGGLLFTGLLYGIGQACSLAGPLLLREIVQGLQCLGIQKNHPNVQCDPKSKLYYYIIGLFLAPAFQTVCENQQLFLLYRLGTRMRNALMAAIYRKCLRLSNAALQAESTGRVVTLMSNDAQKLQDAMFAIHAMWGSPAYIIAVLVLLWFQVGWATFVGLGVMLVMVPLTGFLAGKLAMLRREIMQWTDKRVGRMNELINGIQMIKFYAWEPSFRAAVAEFRGKEAAILRRMALWQGLFGLLLFYGPVAVALFCFGSYAIAGETLTPAAAYTALALFSLLRFPMSFLPMLVTMIVNALVAIKRIQGFLQREEAALEPWDETKTPAGMVAIRGGAFSWDAAAEKPTLEGIELSATRGSLTMVVGGVGSGKSSLLAALIGHIGKKAGEVEVGGRIAYVAQTAWIMNDTVQENVLMGGALDPARYRAALEAAQLGPDLAILPNGDLTEIGDRGITLSGGQKQRVSIARAMWAGGGWLWFLPLLALFAIEQGARVYTDTWVGHWFGDKYDRTTGFYLGIYFMLGAVYGLLTFVRSTTFLFFCVRAAVSIHNQLLDHILALPKSFFDTNPAGRILNRFSRDTDIMDSTLAASLIQFAGSVATYIAILIVITIATKWFGIALVPLTIIYFTIQRYYIPAARELQRIESVSRSPIYSRFAEALLGVATIRAYRLEAHFVAASDGLMERNAHAFITQKLASSWLASRLDMLGLAILTLCGALVIQGGIDPGMAGLALVYALDLTRFLKHGTNMASKSEADFNSVERIVQYLAPEREARPDTPPEVASTVPPEWPSAGAIEVVDLSMRYRPGMPLVLKGVTFSVAAGEKLGLVGRTGSGKSSLLLALFRMVEPEGGCIRIDGVDISKLGLQHLRSKMSIIPQDPFMFSGTVRHNLDPFEQATDQQLWEAVEAVGLQPAISALEDKLGAKVVDGGANFSLGQRQLFCLARAMLRRSRVLMLDEATASVDVDTDSHIQGALRSAFGDVTCLTIAHRLNTIMDADRVVVLEAGRVVENDAPARLLEKPESLFTSMVDQTGRSASRYLKHLARSAAEMRAEGAAAGTPRSEVLNRIRSLFATQASFARMPNSASRERLSELANSGTGSGQDTPTRCGTSDLQVVAEVNEEAERASMDVKK